MPNPSVSEADAVHSVAEDAAETVSQAAPSATEDLNASTWDGLGGMPGDATQSGRVAAPATSAEPAAPAAPEPEIDEEDWQFSEEVRIEGDEPDEGLSADLGDDSDFGETGSFDNEGLDPAALAEEGMDEDLDLGASASGAAEISQVRHDEIGSGLELDGPEASAEPARDESSFGTVDDFSSLMEDEQPAAAIDVAASLGSEITAELEGEKPPDAASALDTTEAPVGTYSGGGQSDDLGDPESWDLVGSDDMAVGAAALGRAASSGPIATASPEEFFTGDAFGDVGFDDLESRRSLAAGPLGFVGRLIGWAAALAAVGAVALLAYQADRARWATTPEIVQLGDLEAESLAMGWVDTSRSGSLLRLVGEVRNTGTTAQRPGPIQFALLDRAGERLSAPALAAGIPLSVAVMRESAFDGLGATLTEARRRLSARDLAPGTSRRFEALIPAALVPEAAARVQLEMLDARDASNAPVPTPAATVAESTTEAGSSATEVAAGVEAATEAATRTEGASPGDPVSTSGGGTADSDGLPEIAPEG